MLSYVKYLASKKSKIIKTNLGIEKNATSYLMRNLSVLINDEGKKLENIIKGGR